ncbi:RNA polymerase sigma factor [Streptomyces ossamyceticus]|uniref:Sigma-70 family RNA polymerase sigma factor n=1 Tax=Streptomyces ossamyceticus TaxID=249581 RepID=A0ABV2V3Z1_9ACTN
MTSGAGFAGEPRRGEVVAGTEGIFNAVIGTVGLYAATGSLWMAAAAGGVAAGLAGLRFALGRRRVAREGATGTAGNPPAPMAPSPDIGEARADGGGGMRLPEEPEERKPFEDFFREEYPRVVYAVMRLGANSAEAEDIASDAMLKTLMRWADIADPAAYTHTSARREYFRKAKQKLREAPLEEERAREGSEPSVTDSLDLGDQERRVLRVLDRLPRAQRTVMHLHYAGLSTEEIARHLETPEATVRSNLRHARQRLRTLLSDEGLI